MNKEMREGFRRNCYLGNNLQEGKRMSLTNIWEKSVEAERRASVKPEVGACMRLEQEEGGGR